MEVISRRRATCLSRLCVGNYMRRSVGRRSSHRSKEVHSVARNESSHVEIKISIIV